jgi:hypothetical protein
LQNGNAAIRHLFNDLQRCNLATFVKKDHPKTAVFNPILLKLAKPADPCRNHIPGTYDVTVSWNHNWGNEPDEKF